MAIHIIHENKVTWALVLIIVLLMGWTVAMYRINFVQDPCAWSTNWHDEIEDQSFTKDDGDIIIKLNDEGVMEIKGCDDDKCDFKGVTLPTNCNNTVAYNKNKLFANRVNTIGYIIMILVFCYVVYSCVRYKKKSPYYRAIQNIKQYFDNEK